MSRKAGERAVFSGVPVRAEPHTYRGWKPIDVRKFGYEAYFSFQLGF